MWHRLMPNAYLSGSWALLPVEATRTCVQQRVDGNRDVSANCILNDCCGCT